MSAVLLLLLVTLVPAAYYRGRRRGLNRHMCTWTTTFTIPEVDRLPLDQVAVKCTTCDTDIPSAVVEVVRVKVDGKTRLVAVLDEADLTTHAFHHEQAIA